MRKTWIHVVMFLLIAFAGNVQALEVDILGGIDVHGFISQGYIESKDNNYLANNSEDGTFGFNEIGINFSKQLTDKLRIGLQLFSRDLGAIGNNDIVLDWAFADYRWKDWLGVRVGKIKAPHGLYNETRDIDMLRTSIFLPQSVYQEIYRDAVVAVNGLGVYGNVSCDVMGNFAYYVLGGTMDISGDADNGIVREINSYPQLEVSGDADVKDAYVASLEWRAPLEGLLLKYTWKRLEYEVPCGTLTLRVNKQTERVYSIEYTWNDLLLAAEYFKYRGYIDTIATSGGGIIQEVLAKRYGYYFSAAYRFTDWFEAGAYYSKYYPDSDDKGGSKGIVPQPPNPNPNYDYNYQAWLKDWALSLRFDINEHWVAKVEGHLMDGAALCLGIDNDDFEDDWYMFAAKLTFSF